MTKKRRNGNELYETMRDAIHYMRTHAREHPDAGTVAKAVGMQPSRFNHAFAEWVGLPPKRFLAYLAKERAKRLILDSKDILHASYKAGLSGPGRLHHLLVTHEAVSPGELKSGVVRIWYGIHPSPFGWCFIALTKRGICHLSFLDGKAGAAPLKALTASWPKAAIIRDDARVKPYHAKIFSARGGTVKRLPLVVQGTNFQVKVWEALLAIPAGKVATYGEIARRIGAPKAVRAVGSACGKNPICFLIPCHRVLSSDGGLGGYASGTPRKDAMLTWEAARETK